MDASSTVNARARSQGWHSSSSKQLVLFCRRSTGPDRTTDARGFLSRRLSPGISPVQAFANEGLDDRLAADIQASGFLIEVLQHLRGEIDAHPPDGIHHLSAGEKSGDILTLIRHARDGFGTDGISFS
jgi:hypothetical protein